MKERFHIIVEGIADLVFFEQYYQHLFGKPAPEGFIFKTDGKDNLHKFVNKMRSMTANDGVNLVIFDADKDIDARRNELLEWKEKAGVNFELFLLPNNKNKGALEDLLESIINPNNRPIFNCWEDYEKELVKLEIPGRTPPPLTTPAKKTKIYGYLEALLGPTNDEKELIKERNREYFNTKHWNLDAEYLEPLRRFLIEHLKEN
ncbi:MAG: hypothetical protein IKZ99_11965 [Salinivirgaceae bacterium]|nr:hypothetical protein [Salinivirgaceae bacterium]